MYKNSLTHYITKIMVDIMFFGGILCLLAVPLLAKFIQNLYGYSDSVSIPFMFVLLSSGVCAVYILFILKQMFKTLLGGNPFVDANTNCFRKIAVACSLISLIYAVKCIFMFSFATLIIILVFAIGSLFCLTLKDIFKQAVAYKEENDLTI